MRASSCVLIDILRHFLTFQTTDQLTKEMISILTDNENNCCLQPASPHCVSNIFFFIKESLTDCVTLQVARLLSDSHINETASCPCPQPPLCYYAGISSIPVLSDDRLLSGQSATYCFLSSVGTERGRGRAGMMLSASKICAGIRTKHSASVDRNPPCNLGDVRLF